jgi:D-alanyl-D-alanine carboxypeptidase/D-alanyl-D-alanine-endopeptidase (penicillin-binding protein 4)
MQRVLPALGALISLLAAAPVAASASAQRAHSAQSSLAATLGQDMAQIGGASGALVVDLNTGQTLFSDQAGTGRLPASTEKVYTTSTALIRFGPNATLSTAVAGKGWLGNRGIWHGTLYLQGGGDPTFGSAGFVGSAYGGSGATVEQLARGLRKAGIKGVVGQVVGDESYFDSQRGTSESGFQFDPYMEGSLSALAFNRGVIGSGSTYIYHPALYAAQQLVSALQGAGVNVSASTSAGVTPRGTPRLASVNSPTIAHLVQMTNTPSDNFFAEMLVKGIGARFGAGGSTASGAGVVIGVLARRFGIHPKLVDGSGLSYADSTSPSQMVTALTKLRFNHAFWDSLAVGGESGTLADEMRGTHAQGNCRGKTGTLSSVANLVGYCHARNGHTLAFAFYANSVGDTSYVHSVEGNRMAVALADYTG